MEYYNAISYNYKNEAYKYTKNIEIKKPPLQRFLTGNVLDSPPIQTTMLADEVLNFWVRDGTRCDHFSIVTGS